MASLRSYESVVLQTHDVGEADRFCVLFTRERGKCAALARGARRLSSRMGSLLLPLRHLTVNLHEKGEGKLITAVSDLDEVTERTQDVTSFVRIAEGVELLLRLTEDDEPLPTVFDLLLQFRDACRDGSPDPVLPFHLSLLQCLGILPVTAEDHRFARLSDVSQSFVWSCARHRSFPHLCALPREEREVEQFRLELFAEHLSRPLKTSSTHSWVRR